MTNNDNSTFSGSPLGVTPIVLQNTVFAPMEYRPELSSRGKGGIVHMTFSEKIMIDASEFLNAIYDDMS